MGIHFAPPCFCLFYYRGESAVKTGEKSGETKKYKNFLKKYLQFCRGYAIISKSLRHAPVAQLDRVTDYESVGRGFESLPAYHLPMESLIQWFHRDFLFFMIET